MNLHGLSPEYFADSTTTALLSETVEQLAERAKIESQLAEQGQPQDKINALVNIVLFDHFATEVDRQIADQHKTAIGVSLGMEFGPSIDAETLLFQVKNDYMKELMALRVPALSGEHDALPDGPVEVSDELRIEVDMAFADFHASRWRSQT